MTIKRNAPAKSSTKLSFKRMWFTKTSTLMVNDFKIPTIITVQGFITLKKAADDNVRFTRPSLKQLHGFDIPTIDTTPKATKTKKTVRFSQQQQTFYFQPRESKSSLQAASI